MKVWVYAIAKDEAKHIDRWVASMGEADGISVLDTGSTDGTPDLLRAKGVNVEVWADVPSPFHFAEARNRAMALCPDDADILVCTDLDEVFTKGWVAEVRKAFEAVPVAGYAACQFVTRFADDGVTPADTMHYWKIHRNHIGAKWVARVHEYLTYEKPQLEVYISDIRLEHHPDPDKPRTQYLDLLALEAKENPCPRSLHYYGRELMFRKRYGEAIVQLKKYLEHPDAKWIDERAWTMRYIGRCYGFLRMYTDSITWFVRAMAEAPNQRESACDLGDMAMSPLGDWRLCAFAANVALSRNDRPTHYFTEEACWKEKPHDLLAVALHNIGDERGALVHAEEAARLAPNNARIVNNAKSIRANVARMEQAAGKPEMEKEG